MKLTKYLFVLLCFESLVFFMISNTCLAQDQNEEDAKIQMKAKKRIYPGGKDEESLKVQSQLPQAIRKMSPVTEAPVESTAPDSEHD